MGGAARIDELIEQCALGRELEGGACTVLGSFSQVRDLAEGEVLFKEDEDDGCAHMVISGKLAVTRRTGGGADAILHVIEQGDLAGEMGFVDGTPHSATVKALTAARVVSLDRKKFEALLDTNPRLVYDVMRAIVRRVHHTLRRMNLQYVELTNYISQQHGRY
jgi:CRP/FNR family transcriptional regulator, cyclic AMP receptor protein